MRKSLLFILTIFSCLLLKAQKAELYSTIARERPADFEHLSCPDSTGHRTALKTTAASGRGRITSDNIKLPYPILFIHGLNSDAETWNTMTAFMSTQYGLSNGGRFDYCLNFDASDAIANTKFHPTPEADIALFTGTWVPGDYYFVNYDVGSDGGFNPSASAANQVLSNQSAIVKQGVALRDAISRILELTGRDKVVIMGHSMGGLATREYLQNPDNWQADGKTHVAKLATTGTPHGGSNATSFGIISNNTEGQSEAIRDLRRSYFYTDNAGVYLFGGPEDLPYMEDQLCCYFYNSDVNCNGATDATVVGLNQKDMYTDLDYACIVGECTGCLASPHPGDGIVWNVCADLNNYYTGITSNLFYYYASAAIEIHTDLPDQYYQNMQGLDEPDAYNLAYRIGIDTVYTGFFTIPSAGNPNAPNDIDTYKFSISENSNVTVNVHNIVDLEFGVAVVNSSDQIVASASHNSGSTQPIALESWLVAGDYYLQLSAVPNTTSYLTPYRVSLNSSTTGLSSGIQADQISLYPNPTNGKFMVETNSAEKQEVELVDISGRSVFKETIGDAETIDVTHLINGVYTLKIKTTKGIINKKIIVLH